MNAIIYYSNTNQSKYIAQYFEKKLGYPLIDICNIKKYSYQNVVLIFPVYCQNIPDIVKGFLNKLEVRFLTVIATYGRMWYGNVLHQVQKQYKHNIIAGAYIPTKHSFLSDKEFDDFNRLDVIVNKINNPSSVHIPKSFKNPLSNIFRDLRSRIGVKITRNESCNHCGVCENNCPNKAIINGKTNRNCIRCLRCVTNCPVGALKFYNRLPLRLYLNKKKTDKMVVYI